MAPQSNFKPDTCPALVRQICYLTERIAKFILCVVGVAAKIPVIINVDQFSCIVYEFEFSSIRL